jgi:hypothetical protein
MQLSTIMSMPRLTTTGPTSVYDMKGLTRTFADENTSLRFSIALDTLWNVLPSGKHWPLPQDSPILGKSASPSDRELAQHTKNWGCLFCSVAVDSC